MSIKIEDLINMNQLKLFLNNDKECLFTALAKYTRYASSPFKRHVSYESKKNKALVMATLDTIYDSNTDDCLIDGTMVQSRRIHHRLGAYLAMKLAQERDFDLLLVDKPSHRYGSTAKDFISNKRYNFVVELGRQGMITSTNGCTKKALINGLNKYGIKTETWATLSNAEDLDLQGSPGMFILGLGYREPYSPTCSVDLCDVALQIDRLLDFQNAYRNVQFIRESGAGKRNYSSGYTPSMTYSYKPYKPTPKDYTIHSCECGAMYCKHELGKDKKCLVCDKDTVNTNSKIMEVN